MRNGMSVKEIHDALDQFDRLKKAYNELREENDRLKQAVDKSVTELLSTASTYNRIADNAALHDDITKVEFSSRCIGLLEACEIIRKYTNPERLKGE